MAKAPKKCPMCKSKKFIKADKGKKGFSVTKSIVGTVFAGPIGIVAGGLGKKHVTMACRDCGFIHEYKK